MSKASQNTGQAERTALKATDGSVFIQQYLQDLDPSMWDVWIEEPPEEWTHVLLDGVSQIKHLDVSSLGGAVRQQVACTQGAGQRQRCTPGRESASREAPVRQCAHPQQRDDNDWVHEVDCVGCGETTSLTTSTGISTRISVTTSRSM